VKFRLLGSGTSSGVPRIGGEWGACDPANPRNRRTRAAALVSTRRTAVLIDTGPDMREQLLAADVARVDAVIWTHDHADHTHGIDDLRQLYHLQGSALRGLARPATMASLLEKFPYVFEGRDGYPAVVALEPLPDTLEIGDLRLRCVDQPHGNISSAGLRFEHEGRTVGYATDFKTLTPEMRIVYEGLDLWVADALRRPPHPTHPSLADVIGWHRELRPARTVLGHMDHSMDYATLCAELPAGIEPGYDGLEVIL
jgi:phosphoribosyl 1,2-cyclic phosphate phosphodiesterase